MNLARVMGPICGGRRRSLAMETAMIDQPVPLDSVRILEGYGLREQLWAWTVAEWSRLRGQLERIDADDALDPDLRCHLVDEPEDEDDDDGERVWR